MSWVWDHAETFELTSPELFVLIVIADHANQDGYNSFPSQTTIARQTALSVRSVGRIAKRLQQKGIIAVRKEVNGPFVHNSYSLLEFKPTPRHRVGTPPTQSPTNHPKNHNRSGHKETCICNWCLAGEPSPQ